MKVSSPEKRHTLRRVSVGIEDTLKNTNQSQENKGVALKIISDRREPMANITITSCLHGEIVSANLSSTEELNNKRIENQSNTIVECQTRSATYDQTEMFSGENIGEKRLTKSAEYYNPNQVSTLFLK